MRLLEGLRLNPSKSFSGRVRGERLTQKKGLSIEFADYRNYTEGDDLRHLDWNVLARLETPILKTYRDEEDLAVHLLLDASASMAFGDPSKFAAAQRAAAALGYVALAGGDALSLHALPLARPPANFRGRARFPRLNHAVQALAPEGQAGLTSGLRHFANSNARVGLVVLISDGMDPEIVSGLRTLSGRGHEVFFLQILSPIERDPDLEGDLRLLDAESAPAVEITASAATLKAYRHNLNAHLESIRQTVLRQGGRTALISSDDSLESLVRGVLRQAGWART